jgi:hypothetical protein
VLLRHQVILSLRPDPVAGRDTRLITPHSTVKLPDPHHTTRSEVLKTLFVDTTLRVHPRNSRALHLLAPTTNGTQGTSKSNFIKKLFLFFFNHPNRHTSTHVNTTSLVVFQRHNPAPQPCPAENQTFQPSQMATRNHQHPLAAKCVKDQA